ncbi:MAG: hypothetical protein FWH03_07400 [Firmicutes bacterium]|nr:hypothetical protein [Bacillota bacterium]
MKKVRLLVSVLCAALIAACVFAFAACKEPEDDDPVDGEGVYTFAAAGIDLTGLSGRGYSDEKAETQMIMGENTASIRERANVLNSIERVAPNEGRHFVGYFNTGGTALTFNIRADKASTDNSLTLRLGSEYGTLLLNPEVMQIVVNGEELAYNPITVTGAAQIGYRVPFANHEISQKFDLNEGENEIQLIILENTLGNAVAGFPSVGPGVNNIKIKSDAVLSWDSLWEYNKEDIVHET